MNQRFKEIILATDTLAASRPAVETALNLAREHNANVRIVDTIREPTTVTRWLTSNAHDVFEMVLADKQRRLEDIARRFADAGVAAVSEVLFGKSSEALTRAVVEYDADLLIRHVKGAHSRYPSRYGTTSRNLMRICPCPLLFVGDHPISNYRILACINVEDSKFENESILRVSESLAPDEDHLLGVYCWDLHGKEIMKSHVSESSMQSLLNEADRIHENLLEKFENETDLGLFAGKIRRENGTPQVIIPKMCRDESVDVAVMCSASLNHPLRRLLGSTIESVMEKLDCALLVVKPVGFESPIKVPNLKAV